MRIVAVLAGGLAMAACGGANDAASPAPVAPPPAEPDGTRYAGDWATGPRCSGAVWRFSADGLVTPNGASCAFVEIDRGAPGGIDIAATCIIEGVANGETLRLRFSPEPGGGERMTISGQTIGPATLQRCAGTSRPARASTDR